MGVVGGRRWRCNMWWYVASVIAGVALGYVIAKAQHYWAMCKVNAILREVVDAAQGINDVLREPVT